MSRPDQPARVQAAAAVAELVGGVVDVQLRG